MFYAGVCGTRSIILYFDINKSEERGGKMKNENENYVLRCQRTH